MGVGHDRSPDPAAAPDETPLPRETNSSPHDSPPDRRQFPRIPLTLTVELRFSSAEAVLESSTVDMSEGGVFIRMDEPRREGTAIRLLIRVGQRAVEIEGVVVRTVRPGEGEPPGIGVLFIEMKRDDEIFMHSLVRERLGASSPPDPRRDP